MSEQCQSKGCGVVLTIDGGPRVVTICDGCLKANERAAVAAETERCARVCEAIQNTPTWGQPNPARRCAAAIRRPE